MPKVTIIEPERQRITETENIIPSKLRVAAYARVSTEQDEQESSYEAQVDFYTHHIMANSDWELVKVFADRGITGTSTKHREEFNKMIELALSGGVDLILTKSISRFARNTVDTLQTVRKLKAAGVEVMFEKENLRTFDPKCEVMLTIMSSLAQEESRSISENIRWAQRKNMQEGKVYVAYSHFLGYRKGSDGGMEIVEEEAETVRMIYDLFLKGWTISHIARYLTELSIPTPSGKEKWSASTIKSILSNEKYRGDALLQKTYTVDYLTKEVRKNDGELCQYFVENSHEPIVDPKIFDLVQQKLNQRSAYHRKVRDGSPFSNKIICGDCGEFYGHKVWHNKANTERYDVWYCNNKYRGEKCQSPILRVTEIESAFESALRILGLEVPFTKEVWQEKVESVTVYEDRKLVFRMASGETVEVVASK